MGSSWCIGLIIVSRCWSVGADAPLVVNTWCKRHPVNVQVSRVSPDWEKRKAWTINKKRKELKCPTRTGKK